jgi:hypothetical protein
MGGGLFPVSKKHSGCFPDIVWIKTVFFVGKSHNEKPDIS